MRTISRRFPDRRTAPLFLLPGRWQRDRRAAANPESRGPCRRDRCDSSSAPEWRSTPAAGGPGRPPIPTVGWRAGSRPVFLVLLPTAGWRVSSRASPGECVPGLPSPAHIASGDTGLRRGSMAPLRHSARASTLFRDGRWPTADRLSATAPGLSLRGPERGSPGPGATVIKAGKRAWFISPAKHGPCFPALWKNIHALDHGTDPRKLVGRAGRCRLQPTRGD